MYKLLLSIYLSIYLSVCLSIYIYIYTQWKKTILHSIDFTDELIWKQFAKNVTVIQGARG